MKIPTFRWAALLALLLPASLSNAGDWSDLHVLSDAPAGSGDIRKARDGSILVGWSYYDLNALKGTVYIQRLDETFSPEMDPVRVNEQGSGGSIRFIEDRNENIHVVWNDDRFHPPPFGDSDTFYKLISKDGETIVHDTLIIGGGKNYAGLCFDYIEDAEGAWVKAVATPGNEVWYWRFNLEGERETFRILSLPGRPAIRWYSYLFPNPDGTSHILYMEWVEWNSFAKIYHVLIDGQGTVLEGPTLISHDEDRYYAELGADRDSTGRIHFAFDEYTLDWPMLDRVFSLHYGVLDPEGHREGGLWKMFERRGAGDFITPQVVADDLDRIHVLALGANLEDSTLWVPHGHGIGISITDLRIDPARREVVERERLTADSYYIGPPVTVRPDGEGGLLEVNHRTVTVDGPAYIEARRTIPESLCRNGVVGRPAFDRRTLTLNGSDGDEEHLVRLPAGTPMALGILAPGEGDPGTRFYVQAHAGSPGTGSPGAGSTRWLPGVGLSCYDLLDAGSAQAIWNGLQGAYGKLGHSRVLRTSIPDPPSAPGVFFTIPPQATADLPPGTRVTFQGFQSDPTSKKGFSMTNAVILEIE